MNEIEETTAETPDERANDERAIQEMARKGGVAVSLLVLVVSLIYLFTAVEELLRLWLESRWVPIWRALFAVGVGTLAVWTLLRLTGARD